MIKKKKCILQVILCLETTLSAFLLSLHMHVRVRTRVYGHALGFKIAWYVAFFFFFPVTYNLALFMLQTVYKRLFLGMV